MVSSSPRRPSKFIESLPPMSSPQDSPSTPPTPTDELFFSILSQMDEFEVRSQQAMRNGGTSNPSLDSLSHCSSSPRAANDRSHAVKEGNRGNINFTQSIWDKELEGRRRSGSGSGSAAEGESSEHSGDGLTKKFVGRLRALTGGREKDGWKRHPVS